ncbi:hypothetical protein BY996DRAFT_7157129 [Phakopsora pachyrhizi]|nr:hypothetical protein BY996DRAFT_7157129 [Phakopsora pachyrhizi]
MKFYGIDDDVIMSGANLSHDYFVNRQDRYLLLSNQPELSKYFQDLFHTTCLISYQLSSAPNLPAFKLSWPSSNVHSSPTHSSSSLESFKSIAHELYRSLTVRWQEKSQIKMKAVESDRCISRRGGLVSIFPVLQMGSFRINQETSALIPKLIEFAKELSNLQDGYRTRLNWTSGYFSLLREYKQQLLESDLDVQIITASPEANGFYNSRGVSKYIPSAYTYLEYMFYKDIISKQKQDKIQIREWKRPGWTYHAKGIWITRTIERMGSEQEVEEECLLTTIGSSNYGRRSAERDLECNLILINNRLDPKKPNQPESSLSKELIEELNQLRSLAVDKVDEDLFRSQERRVGLGVKLATRLIRNML